MALTIVVRSAEEASGADAAELSLTVDAPRIVIGRGDGCEVRVPDASVSQRHASLRQKGGEWVVIDEGSANGTFMGHVRLPPQTPRAVRSGELVRVGRVWLEIRIQPGIVQSKQKMAAKELALELVSRGLAAGGDEPWPRITVVGGPDLGARVVVRDAGRDYLIGKAKECDLVLSDPDVGRRHLAVRRKADALQVVVYGGTNGAFFDGERVGENTETPWQPRQELTVVKSRLMLEYPAAEALAEIEKGPDELMREGDVPAPPSTASTEPPGPPAAEGPPTDVVVKPVVRRPERGWGAIDGIVILLAVGVLVVSLVGGWWLLGH